MANRKKAKCTTCDAAAGRASQILEIKAGTVTVYTAYLVVFFRLLVVAAHAVLPGLQ